MNNNLKNKRICLKFILASSLVFLLFSSCTDDVEIKIQDSNTELLVVEGLVSIYESSIFFNNRGIIRLTKSQNYHESDADKPMLGAKVYLTDLINTDTIYVKEENNGLYSFEQNLTETEHSYQLHIVTKEGKIYESNYQKVSKAVPIKSLNVLPYSYLTKNAYLFDKFLIGDDDPDFLVAELEDPKDTLNYYVWSANGLNFYGLKLLSDIDFGDGASLPYEYLWFNIQVEKGKSETIFQYSLNENTYNYIKEVQNLLINSGTPFSSPPSNPISNIKCISHPKEEVLGYFDFLVAKRGYSFTNNK